MTFFVLYRNSLKKKVSSNEPTDTTSEEESHQHHHQQQQHQQHQHNHHQKTSRTVREMFEEPDGSKVFTINHQSFSNFTSKPSSTLPTPLYRSRSCLGSHLNNGFSLDYQVPVPMTTTTANNNTNDKTNGGGGYGYEKDSLRLPSIIHRGGSIFNNNNNNNNNNSHLTIGRSHSDINKYEINQDILNWSKGNTKTNAGANNKDKKNNNNDNSIRDGKVKLIMDRSETKNNDITLSYVP